MLANDRMFVYEFSQYLSLGYSTPFLSLGESYMYSSLAAAKAAVISVGEEIASQLGLPAGICPLVLYLLAQEMFLLEYERYLNFFLTVLWIRTSFQSYLKWLISGYIWASNRVLQVYRCVVTCQDMVQNKDSTKSFDKADYYAHLERYNPIFHERIALYVSVIVNCMYWE
ncbi:hypothetical protein CsatB_029551 [Cannabis sativa]